VSPRASKAREVQLAFVFLTRVPVGRLPDPAPSLPHAAWAFPLVGLAVGAVTGAVFVAAQMLLPGLAAAFLAIAAGLILTGALHEDGLADVADGFGGGATREAKLEIMRDSRIGSYGVLALIVVLGMIAAAMAEAPPTWSTFAIFMTIGAVSRGAMLIPMEHLPSARTEGLGHSAVLSKDSGVGLAIAIVCAALTNMWFLIAAGLAVGAMEWLAKRQIGGQTGDVLGATQKITECALWLTAAATLA